MNFLLDTHAFIWLDNERERLSPKAAEACRNLSNKLFLSVASVWEMQIKAATGKLRLINPLGTIVASQMENGIEVIAITLIDVLALEMLPLYHRDPFDRLLVAQAQSRGMTLITHDALLAQYNVPILW